MNAIGLLREQHKRLASLFKRAVAAEPAGKQLLFDQIVQELALHTTLEEQHFYPAVRARRTEGILLDSLEEHWIMKRVLEQLFELSAFDEAFDARLRVLNDLIENHFEEEESELLPRVARAFSKEALEALGAEMTQVVLRWQHDLAQRRAEPSSPGSPSVRFGLGEHGLQR